MEPAVLNWFAKLKEASVLQPFELPNKNIQSCKLFVKRDDLIDAHISGNKLRKLEGNLRAAAAAGATRLATFGGAYSNHLLASAAAAQQLRIPITGYVRGDELCATSNPILRRCHEFGMQLEFSTRSAYQKLKLKSGLDLPTQTWYIPEGGANPEGIWGCQQIYQEAVRQNNQQHFDVVFIAQGTTTTSLGILASIPPSTQLFVVPVLKGFDSIAEMQQLIEQAQRATLTSNLVFPMEQLIVLDQYHHGGYAKTSIELNAFIAVFNQHQQFPIEASYTGKALFALNAHLRAFQDKSVLFIHTGGVV
ncbi:MAG: hypothetical protein RLZZ301_956 [Bacteroidota bacterium]